MNALPRVVVVLLVCALCLRADGASAQIVMSELPLLPDATSSTAGAINAAGSIVGSMSFPTAPFGRAVIWVGGTPEELPRLCATCNANAIDINDAGEVSGFVINTDGSTSAVVWSNGTVTALPPLAGHTSGMAMSINNSGVVVGSSTMADGVPRPVRWVDGLPEDLGHIESVDMPSGFALGINNAGEIVGALRPLDGQSERGFVWRNGVMTGLQIPLDETCNQFSAGLDNNDSGLIVGYVFIACRQTAAVWENGVLRMLPPLPNIPTFPGPQGGGSALEVNEHGDIVGLGNPSFGPAALWRNGDVINLGALEPQTLPNGVAFDINDDGVAVGWSRRTVGLRAVMWTTTPPNTPPALTLPAGPIVNASSPGGAVVSFSATASDEQDGDFLPVCSPASGSLFPVGTSTVSCIATDSGGLEATGSFTVTIRGALAQIDDLIAEASGVGPGRSLENTLRVARAAITASRPLTAAVTLRVFDLQVTLLAITRRLPVDQAITLLEASRQIRATIGF